MQARKQAALALATWLEQDLSPNVIKAALGVTEPGDAAPGGPEAEGGASEAVAPLPGLGPREAYCALCLLGGCRACRALHAGRQALPLKRLGPALPAPPALSAGRGAPSLP
jgi:hypothetical protein